MTSHRVADARAQGGTAKPDSRVVFLDRGVPSTDPRVAAAWAEWLRTMRWDWWATPSFHHPTSPARALQAVTEWLAASTCRDPHLRPTMWCEPYAAVGLQHGPMGDRLHVHVVVGGTGRHPSCERGLRDSWRRGNLDLKGYTPAKGAIEYLVRQADEVVILGSPVRYRPH